MKKLAITSLFLLILGTSFGQEKKDHFDRLHFNAVIQTNHLWRGLIITDQPVITGQLWFDINKEKTLYVGVWGASSFSNDDDGTHYQEINYFVYFEKNGWFIGLWDLYNTRDVNTLVASEDVFNYSRKRTNHILDLRSAYTFQNDFPLRIELDIPLYGGANAGEVLLRPDGKYSANRYSTYLEVGYPFVQAENVVFNGFVGAGFPLKTKGNSSHLYGNGQNDFDIVNVGFNASRSFKIGEINLPVSFMTIWNPSQKYTRVQLAASFNIL